MVPEFPIEDCSKYELWFLIGWPYQTTVAMSRLAFSGIFEEFSSVKDRYSSCRSHDPYAGRPY